MSLWFMHCSIIYICNLQIRRLKAKFPMRHVDASAELSARLSNLKELCQKFHLGQYSHPNGSNDLGLKDPPTPQYSYFFLNQ